MATDASTTYRTPTPVCPHCGYAMDHEDMNSCESSEYLPDIAPTEQTASAQCPICEANFWIRGGYTPHYTTAFAEEELQ